MNLSFFDSLRALSNPNSTTDRIHEALTSLHALATKLHEDRRAAQVASDDRRMNAIPPVGDPLTPDEHKAFVQALDELRGEALTPVASFVAADAQSVPEVVFPPIEKTGEVRVFSDEVPTDPEPQAGFPVAEPPPGGWPEVAPAPHTFTPIETFAETE